MKIDKIETIRMRNDSRFQFHTEFKDLVFKNGEVEEVENEI